MIRCARFFFVFFFFSHTIVTLFFTRQVTMIIEHVMCLAVSIRNARLHVIANEQRLIVRHEVSRKSHGTYRFTPPNCKCTKLFIRLTQTHTYAYSHMENQLFQNYANNKSIHIFISIFVVVKFLLCTDYWTIMNWAASNQMAYLVVCQI